MDSITAREKETKDLNDEFQIAEESIRCKMESLQAELIMDISSRVPTLDLPKLRYVCKRWNNILNDPLFHRLHLSHSMSKPKENQVLVIKSSSGLYLVDLTDKMSPRQIATDLPFLPDLWGFHYLGSCNGLLCLGDVYRRKGFIVMNPITRQHVFFSMDQNIYRDQICSWGFGFDEINKLFKVVVVVSNRNQMGHSEVRICDLGKGGNTYWRNTGVTTFSMGLNPISAPFLNGRLRWADWTHDSHGLISYDLTDEEFRPIPTPDFLCVGMCFNLFVLDGCLCIFHCRYLESLKIQIWVVEEYGIKASWVKKFGSQPLVRS